MSKMRIDVEPTRLGLRIFAVVTFILALLSISENAITNINCDGSYPAETVATRLFVHQYDRLSFPWGRCGGGFQFPYPAGEFVFSGTNEIVPIEQIYYIDLFFYWTNDWILIAVSILLFGVTVTRKEYLQVVREFERI